MGIPFGESYVAKGVGGVQGPAWQKVGKLPATCKKFARNKKGTQAKGIRTCKRKNA